MVPHCNWRGAGLVWIFGIQTDPNSKSVRSCHILNLARIIFELKQIASRASVNHHSITGHDEHGELLPCNKDAGKEPHQFMNMPFGGRAGWELASSWFELPKSWCENCFHGKLTYSNQELGRVFRSIWAILRHASRDHGSRTWKKVEVPGESQRLRNNGWQVGILFPVAFGTHWSPGSPGSSRVPWFVSEARHITTDADRPWTNFRGTTIHVTQGTCDVWSSSTMDFIWYYGKSFLAIVLQWYIYIYMQIIQFTLHNIHRWDSIRPHHCLISPQPWEMWHRNKLAKQPPWKYWPINWPMMFPTDIHSHR